MDANTSPLRWHVMTHLDLPTFVGWFDYVNAERMENQGSLIQAFYPYDFMRGRIRETRVVTDKDNKYHTVKADAHQVLRHFVFLKATDEDITNIVYSAANLQSRVRLRRYLTPTGEQAIVRDDVMSEFLLNCIEYRDRFELVPPAETIGVRDKVRIKAGLYKGFEATVMRATLHKGTLKFELAIPMVNGQINVCLKEVLATDVVPINPADATALRADFIRYTRDHVLRILSRRAELAEQIKKEKKQRASADASAALANTLTKEQKKALKPFLEDSDTLERLLRYRDYEISNASARAHFKALMLICAHLSKDVEGEKQLRQEVTRLLAVNPATGDFAVNTDAQAYLSIALKISTNAPNYRDKVKEYVRVRQPKSQHLKEFVALIRKDVKY